MQLLVPIVVCVAFYRQHSYFAAGLGLFWLGGSLIDLSYYVADARAQQLISDIALHDWNWLLSSMNLLPYDTLIGAILHILGVLTLLTGIAAMGFLIFYRSCKTRSEQTGAIQF